MYDYRIKQKIKIYIVSLMNQFYLKYVYSVYVLKMTEGATMNTVKFDCSRGSTKIQQAYVMQTDRLTEL